MLQPRLIPILFGRRTITPASLFAMNEVGAWYDPIDLSKMFQDSAGTTLVTAVEQPVGLILDKSKALALGSELLSTGVVGLLGAATAATYNTSTGQGTVSRVDVSNQSYVSFTVVSGSVYQIIVTNTGATSCYIRLGSAAGTTPVTVAAGSTYSGNLSGAVTSFVITAVTSGTTATFTVTTIKLVTGNHASQATSTSRPSLKEEATGVARSLGLLGTDDFLTASTGGAGTAGLLLCAGFKAGAVGADQTIWSDAGTNTGYRVRMNASNQLELSIGTGAGRTTIATTETMAANDVRVITAWHDGTNASVQIGNGAIASAACGAASAGTTGFTIGRDNGAASSYTTARLFTTLYLRGSASTEPVRAAMKRWCAASAGISL